MKNLKKVLALVMAFACAFTMFAGAANVDFSDNADIVNKDAVNMLAALNVINGYEDGSFKPTGNVTRAEMAKMIYIIRSGGNTSADNYATTASSFTDLDDAWSRGFIKYCQTNGIIAGKSATKFEPKGNVTVQETAKMALVVLGYRADKAGLTGVNWSKNTLTLAGDNKILDGIKTAVDQPATRDDAARILHNLLDAEVVVWSNDKEEFIKDTVTVGSGSSSYTATRTAGEKYLGLKKSVGVLSAVENTYGTKTYEMTLTNLNKEESSENPITEFSKVDSDYSSYKYQQVKVLYKSKTEVYGVYPLSDATTLKATLGSFEMDGTRLKYNSNKYTIADTASIAIDGEIVAGEGASKALAFATFMTSEYYAEDYAKTNGYIAKSYDTVAVSEVDTGKIAKLNVESYAVAKVTSVGSNFINVSTKVAANGVSYKAKITDSDATWYEGIKKDDYVAITAASNTNSDKLGITKLDVVTGKVTSLSNSNKHNQKIKIGDTTYTYAMKKNGTYYSNEEIKLRANVAVVVKNDYVVWVDNAKAVSDDMALVIAYEKEAGTFKDKYIADMLFADGTRKEVDIKTIDGTAVDKATKIPEKTLVTYVKSGDKYEVDMVNSDASAMSAGYDKFTAMTGAGIYIDSNKFTSNTASNLAIKYIDDGASIFLQYKSNGDTKYGVITGAALKKWSKSVEAQTVNVISSASSGTQYAKVAFMDIGNSNIPGGAGVNYAYVTGTGTKTENGVNYTEINGWNGTGNVTLKVETTSTYDKGTVVQYTENADGTASIDLTIKKGSSWTVGAITAKAGDFEKLDGASMTIKFGNGASDYKDLELDKDDDCVVLFIDSHSDKDDDTGVIQSSPELAVETTDGMKLYANAAYYESNKKVVVVVDTANNIAADLFNGNDSEILITK